MNTLFESKLITHKADPQTSFEAADKMIKSGKLTEQQAFVYYVIQLHRGDKDFTAKELSKDSGEDYFLIQRRLGELGLKGKIERTGQKRNGCCVWRIVGS